MSGYRSRLSLSVCLAGMCCAPGLGASGAAPAKDPQPGNVAESSPPDSTSPTRTRLDDLRVFRPDFYSDFHPRTALDMVLKTPGFQLDIGSGGRGLDGAAGNVLINGVRPPAKASPVTEALSAIPAAEVVAIILVPAGTLDVDMASHPLLINVIRAANEGVEWSTTLKAADRSSQGSSHAAAADARWTNGQRVVSINAQQSQSESIAKGSIAAPVSGQSVARETSGTRSSTEARQLSATGQWGGLKGHQLQVRVNLSEQAGASRPLSVTNENALRSSGERSAHTQELAAEWQVPVSETAYMAVTALYTRDKSDSVSLLKVSNTQSESSSQSSSGETALRGELRGNLTPKVSYQAGVDYAENSLDGDLDYSVDGVQIDIPGSASEVAEQRGGAFGSATWTPNPNWTSQATLRWEQSNLSNRADTDASYTFDDWIPRVMTTWTPTAGSKVQAKAERVVGQLAFYQFLAAVQLQSQIITAGARTLQPERSWIYGLDYERRFGERGLLSAGIERQRIDNPIDSIAIDDESEIAANVGPATRDSVTLTLSAPLDRVGLSGGLLSANLAKTFSGTVDPVTGQSRSVSGVSPDLSAHVSLRQTLPKGAWGLSGSSELAYTSYGVRQTSQLRLSPTLSLFGEWRPRSAIAARLTVYTPGRTTSETALYTAPRADGDPDLIYTSTSTQNPTWQARFEWEPYTQAMLELAVTPKAETVVVGRTDSGVPGVAVDTQRSSVQADTVVSAQLKLRW